MSEAAERPEPPRPTPEQLAEWRAAIERLKAGDDSDFIPWEDVAAEFGLRQSSAVPRRHLARGTRPHGRLRHSHLRRRPPGGHIRRWPWLLDFRVLEEQDLIAVLNVTWLG